MNGPPGPTGPSGTNITLTAVTITDQAFGFGPATAGWRAQSNGVAESFQQLIGSWAAITNNWVQSLASGDTPSNYDIRATESSYNGVGTRSGTMNTWLSLSTLRQWTLAINGGPQTGVWWITFEIRRGTTVIATALVKLNVISDF